MESAIAAKLSGKLSQKIVHTSSATAILARSCQGNLHPNQIIPKENIQLTKDKLNTYPYHSDSGKGGQLLLLPQLHNSCLPSSDHHGG